MSYLQYNNARIHYEVHGAGEPLLFIHGWHGSPLSFKNNVLDELVGSYRVIIIDLPGYGKSEIADLSFQGFSDIINSVIDSLGLHRVSIMGFCMGAVIALDYAIRNRDRTKSLLLVEGYVKFPLIIYPLLLKKINFRIFRFFINSRAGEYLMKRYLLLKDAPYRDSFFEVIRTNSVAHSLKYIDLLWNYSRIDHKERIKDVSVPICIVNGEKTHRAIRQSTKLISQCIPRCDVITLHDCRHFPIEENREGITGIIRQFV